MMKELERVELELRRREREELLSLRAQLSAALGRHTGRMTEPPASAPPSPPSAPPPPNALPLPSVRFRKAETQQSVTRVRRLEMCAELSVMLNVAALSAAIAIGAMQFIDA
eukprot:3337550-Pleurochrysis_carterae.AAC.1